MRLQDNQIEVLKNRIFKHFGEQKLDIVLDNGEFKNPFVKHIFEKAVVL
jgi:adenine deaminase